MSGQKGRCPLCELLTSLDDRGLIAHHYMRSSASLGPVVCSGEGMEPDAGWHQTEKRDTDGAVGRGARYYPPREVWRVANREDYGPWDDLQLPRRPYSARRWRRPGCTLCWEAGPPSKGSRGFSARRLGPPARISFPRRGGPGAHSPHLGRQFS